MPDDAAEGGEPARYYDGLVGAWEGVLALEVTRPDAPLARRALGALFRLGPVMRTTLARDGDGWRHTTEVSWAGLRLFWSEEAIRPSADGLEMVGVEHFRFFGGGPYRSCPVTIAEDAAGATYPLAWLGEPMVQRTRIVPEGLSILQETGWSRVTTTLRRR